MKFAEETIAFLTIYYPNGEGSSYLTDAELKTLANELAITYLENAKLKAINKTLLESLKQILDRLEATGLSINFPTPILEAKEAIKQAEKVNT